MYFSRAASCAATAVSLITVFSCEYKLSVDFQERHGRAVHVRSLLRSVTKDAVVASQRRATLSSDWSTILAQLVREAVLEMHDRHEFTKRCYSEETQTQAAKDSDSFRET